MMLGPFLGREMATSARTSRAFSDRRAAVVVAGLIVLGGALLWDRQGWDRSTILGAHRFSLAVFGLMVCAMTLLAFGIVVQQVASAIASERDRKTLDALLASRFSSLEIVLGAVSVGLFRFGNALLATLPVVILMVYLGGVAPTWAILAGVGLASTAGLLAGFAVAASVGARTAARAIVVASGWFGAWLALPPLYLIFRPFVWPGAPSWLTSAVITVVDSSPIGLLMNLLGLIPRRGGAVEAVGRMVAWQVLITLILVAWSTIRLRPASRSLHDVEGEQGRIKRLKAALRRPPRRPPCSDDPVLWYEVHSTRGEGLIRRLANRLIHLAWLAALGLVIWWFARPAFAELAQRGYGPSPEAFALPELHPLIRLMVKLRLPTLPFAASASPGQARLELNVVLRLATVFYALAFVVGVVSAAIESIRGERRRDTWLGLIATPLTAREILRGKALGATWKSRHAVWTLVGLWSIGLLAGAVHPLGFLASLALLATLAAFYPALGLHMALLEGHPKYQGRTSPSVADLLTALPIGIFLTAGPIALALGAPLTYEDIAAAIRSGPFPELREPPVSDWIGARAVLGLWMIGTGGFASGSFWLKRANERGFDAAIGRPVRAEG